MFSSFFFLLSLLLLLLSGEAVKVGERDRLNKKEWQTDWWIFNSDLLSYIKEI